MVSDDARTAKDRVETRLAHLRRLASPDHGLTVGQANEALREVHADGSKPASILVRRAFAARRRRLPVAGEHDKARRSKPPLATLVRPRGVALKLELTLVFLAQCGRRPSAQITFPVQYQSADQLGLIDFFSTGSQPREGTEYRLSRPAMRARQVTNALAALAEPELQLVEVTRKASGRPDTSKPMWLNQEIGPQRTSDPRRYRMPRESETVISIPINFFTQGWIQVMTDSEIANWLMWRDQAEMRDADTTTADDLSLDAQDRLDIYDLTRDTWDTHQMLARLGLMTVSAGAVEARLTSRGARFHREPHRFGLDDAPLSQDGYRAMLAAVAELADEQAPSRIAR